MYDLSVPCGITIPWYADGLLWGIKVRRASGQQRYQQVAGGNIRGCLYLADTIQPGLPLMITEGEFDTLIVRQVAKNTISVASIGSATNRQINIRWFPKFISAPSILICIGSDKAGQEAKAHTAKMLQSAKGLCVPFGKDINEFFLNEGQIVLETWIKRIIQTT